MGVKIIKLDLMGQKYGRLTVVGVAANIGRRTAWLCQCECGTTLPITSDSLRSGNTQSCGCLGREKLAARNRGNTLGRKYTDPKIVSAKSVWRSNYMDGCSFDIFMELSQNPCHYCGLLAAHSNSLNQYLNKNGNLTDSTVTMEWAQQASFQYNGLDRINSSINHRHDNLIASCWVCNRTKRERTYNQFMEHINRLINHKYQRISISDHQQQSSTISLQKLTDPYWYAHKSSVKSILRDDYSDGDLTLEQFYQLSKMNCFYCNIEPSNMVNIHIKRPNGSLHANETGIFIYNGLDRIDSSISHSHSHHNFVNCVASCKYCNYGKQGLSLMEFYDWIDRLEKHRNTLKMIKEKAQTEICA